MAFFADKIGQLVNVYSINTSDHAQICKLESDLADLIEDRDCKKLLLDSLTEQDELCKAELKAQTDTANDFSRAHQDELDAIKQKYKILNAYVSHMSSSDFAINRLKYEGDQYIKEYYVKLRPLVDKGRAIAGQLNKLKETHDKCLELQAKANRSMTANN